MPVDVISPGAGLFTQFSDTLQTVDPNSSTGIGKDWIQGIKSHTPSVDPEAGGICTVGPSNFDGANALLWSNTGSTVANTAWNAFAIPIKKGIYGNIFGLTQFCQATFLQNTQTFRTGLMTNYYGAESSGLTCYELEFTNIATTWFMQQILAFTATVLASGADVISGNDVIRLSADQGTAGQVTVTFKKNGTVINSTVDNSAGHITIGSPGLHCRISSAAGGAHGEWRTFSCGSGL